MPSSMPLDHIIPGVNDGANAHIIAAPFISKIAGFYAGYLDDAQAFSSC